MSLPIHARVADELRGRIHRGELVPGAALPSEARLCEEFGASRGTIRSALAALRHEGLIDGSQGRPPVVRDAVASQPFENLLSFTAWAEQLGRTPGQRTIEVARRLVSGVAAHELGLEPGTLGVDILRVRLLDREPVMVERSTFVEPVGRLLFDFDLDSGSIYAHLTAEGVEGVARRAQVDALGGEVGVDRAGVRIEVEEQAAYRLNKR